MHLEMHQTFFSESTLKRATSLSTSLVMSKTRVAPAKKITLARLELIKGCCYHSLCTYCTYVQDFALIALIALMSKTPLIVPCAVLFAGQTTLQPYSASEEHPRSGSLLLLIGLDS